MTNFLEMECNLVSPSLGTSLFLFCTWLSCYCQNCSAWYNKLGHKHCFLPSGTTAVFHNIRMNQYFITDQPFVYVMSHDRATFCTDGPSIARIVSK